MEADLVLVQRAQSGDQHAMCRLIEQFTPFCVRIARKIRIIGLDFEERLLVAKEQIIRAVRIFDPSRGWKPSTLICSCIHRGMQEYARNVAATHGIKRYGNFNPGGDLHLDDVLAGEIMQVQDVDRDLVDCVTLLRTLRDKLTEREIKVLEGRLAGLSMRQIGDGLGVSVSRIMQHMAEIKKKASPIFEVSLAA